MGGCFSKPKPGDRPPAPCPVTVSLGREVGQRWWTLAGGMLILGSCREDYRLINPPKFLGTLSPRQGAVRGLSSAHTQQCHRNTRCQHLPVLSSHTPRSAQAELPLQPQLLRVAPAPSLLPPLCHSLTLCCPCWKETTREGAVPPTARFLGAFSVPPARAGPGAALLSGFS